MSHVDVVANENAALDRYQRMALMVGLVCLALSAVGAFFDLQQFFRSYLLAYVYCISFALGALGVTMLHNVVGGRWGAVIRRFLAAGRSTLPLMLLLVIPLLVGIPQLYEWSHADVVAHDKVLQHKAGYLNTPFFIVRTVIYFAVWLGLWMLLTRRNVDEVDPREQARARFISAPGLIVFMFTVTFASVDWIMSLEPHWFSTMYGAIYVVGQALSTFALCIVLLALFANRPPFAGLIRQEHFHDLGTLMFAFTVLWAYTSFSQLIIIWSGNIPEETPWFIRRSNNGWQIISVILVLFHFAVPFFLLLSRFIKRRSPLVARVAIWMIFARFLDLIYWVVPSRSDQFGLHWMDIVLPVGLGGLWVFYFLLQLKKGPLLNVNDARIPIAAHGAH